MVKLLLLLVVDVYLGDFLLGHGFSKTKWRPNIIPFCCVVPSYDTTVADQEGVQAVRSNRLSAPTPVLKYPMRPNYSIFIGYLR